MIRWRMKYPRIFAYSSTHAAVQHTQNKYKRPPVGILAKRKKSIAKKITNFGAIQETRETKNGV